jgi:ATP-binding protein involved in chromosome partitioning
MASNALKQLFYDTDWQSIDYLVVDLPPGTGDIHITLTQQLPLAGAVVVTSPSAVALADVRKAIGMLHSPAIRVPVLGLVENMAWFETEELPGRRFYLFGQDGAETLADEYGLPVLAQIPLTEGTRLQGDKGQPIALQPHTPEGQAFAELARRVAQAVSIRNARVAQVAARQDGAAQ